MANFATQLVDRARREAECREARIRVTSASNDRTPANDHVVAAPNSAHEPLEVDNRLDLLRRLDKARTAHQLTKNGIATSSS